MKMDEKRFVRLLEQVSGYLDLGMFAEALELLEQVEAQHRDHPQFLSALMFLYRATERWEKMLDVAGRLAAIMPDEPEVVVCYADAVRRSTSLAKAYDWLKDAENRFPSNSHIKFQLGCYLSQLGKTEPAIAYIREAIEIDSFWAEISRQDRDLEPLWNHPDFPVSTSGGLN